MALLGRLAAYVLVRVGFSVLALAALYQTYIAWNAQPSRPESAVVRSADSSGADGEPADVDQSSFGDGMDQT